jgi:hypothetical protein
MEKALGFITKITEKVAWMEKGGPGTEAENKKPAGPERRGGWESPERNGMNE